MAGIVGLLAALFSVSLARATAFARSAACKSNLRQQGLALSMYLNDFHRYPLSGDSRIAHDMVSSGQQMVRLGAWAKVLKPYVSSQKRFSAEGKAFLCPESESISAADASAALSGLTVSGSRSIEVHGAYGYNAYGTALNWPALNLGLGREWDESPAGDIEEVAESKVQVPSEMIAIGDSTALRPIIAPLVGSTSTRPTSAMAKLLPARRHSKGANIVFCDGHVERLPIKDLVQPSERWNNDNKPHRETW